MYNARELMADAKFFEAYSRFNEELNRYETWEEACEDIIAGHSKKYNNPELEPFLESALESMEEMRMLPKEGLTPESIATLAELVVEIDDIASLSLHYSYEIVMNALSVVYKEYYMYEKTINNLAGLMSTIIRAQFNNLKKAA